jgi:UDP-N-acetylglucosamine 2-epimerase (non-hydrolysing)
MKRKVLCVIGTRPEAIKMAPVIHALLRRPDDFQPVTCLTAQHREMLDQVLRLFQIDPQYDLDIMKQNQDLFDVTCGALLGLRDVIAREDPDIVLAQGDTTTTMTAALAAFYMKKKFGHVEAGLRTRDKFAPFPEEINRRIATVMTDVHFAPTERAMANLVSEGVAGDSIFVTGNTVVDALFEVVKKIRGDAALRKQLDGEFQYLDPAKRLVLVTGHRRENFGEGFRNICLALKKLSERKDVQIVYPVHLNPNVRGPVMGTLSDAENIHLIEPLEYLPFVYLMERSYFILTDSGGVQEEAPSLGKPVLVMREVTERPEAVDAGTVKLVGTSLERILSEAGRLFDEKNVYDEMSMAHNPYGDGTGAEKIVDILLRLK